MDNGFIHLMESYQLGWKLINNKWYFMNNNGIMQRGWVQTNGNWYYLLNNGEMAVSTVTPDGYKVDQNGKWDGKPASTVVTQTADVSGYNKSY